MIQESGISYADLERLGWPNNLINDYQELKDSLSPQSGTDTDPNNVYSSNLSKFYVDTGTPGLWFNPVAGETTGWIQLV